MNLAQFNSLLRYILVTIGSILIEHKLADQGQVTSIFSWVYPSLMVLLPVLWSQWSKTHTAEAAKAIEIVNSVEGIVGDATAKTVLLLPGASPKPAPSAPSNPNPTA